VQKIYQNISTMDSLFFRPLADLSKLGLKQTKP